jgi:hypothetical protein
MAKLINGDSRFISCPFVFTSDWILKAIVPYQGGHGQQPIGNVEDMKFRAKALIDPTTAEVKDCFLFLVKNSFYIMKANKFELGPAQRPDLRVIANAVFNKKAGNYSALLRKSISSFVLLNTYSIMSGYYCYVQAN